MHPLGVLGRGRYRPWASRSSVANTIAGVQTPCNRTGPSVSQTGGAVSCDNSVVPMSGVGGYDHTEAFLLGRYEPGYLLSNQLFISFLRTQSGVGYTGTVKEYLRAALRGKSGDNNSLGVIDRACIPFAFIPALPLGIAALYSGGKDIKKLYFDKTEEAQEATGSAEQIVNQ